MSSSSVAQKFVQFVNGPYLEFNKGHSDLSWEELGSMEKFQGFFREGLRGDQRIKGKSMVQIYVESILKGHRYALDDLEPGKEVREVIKMMLENGGENVKDEIEVFLFSPLRKYKKTEEYLEETFSEQGHYVRAWLFHLFKTKMTKFVKNWDEIEPMEVEDGEDTREDCLRAIKRIVVRGLGFGEEDLD